MKSLFNPDYEELEDFFSPNYDSEMDDFDEELWPLEDEEDY